MRILALGDSHFEDGPRFSECVRIHEWIAELVEQERPDLVLHGGDVYDRASTPLERMAASAFFQRIANVCPVAIAKGNHDRTRDLAILSRLRAPFMINVIESAGTIHAVRRGHAVNVGHAVTVGICAWPSRASAITEDETKATLRDVLRGLGAEMSIYTGPKILLGHFMVDGSKSGRGQPLIGDALNVSLDDLALAGADVAVLGHIHAAQSWHNHGVEMGYTGSPFRTDFGESESKSVSLITLENGACRWERIQTPARAMILLEAHFDGERMVWPDPDLNPTAGFGKVAGADMRFRYTVAPEHREAGRRVAEELRTRWTADGVASLKIDPETVATTRARAPDVARATTLPEKMRALWDSRSEPTPPELQDRLLGRLAQLELSP
jgi:exonuclease SbcD